MKLLTFITGTFLFLTFSSDLTAQTTPPFIEEQRYLYDASLTGTSDIGIGAQNVWFLPGGMGEYVNIVDVEQGWNLNHEDLPPGTQLLYGSNNPSSEDHGTAVLGILVGQDNGFGITGLCPLASIQVSSHYNPTENNEEIELKNAIYFAAQALNAGDILVIEAERVLHGNVKVPVENWLLVRTEIVNAVQAGIIVIVIEAAGNGGRDIAPYVTGNSGAIIVAAGEPGQLIADPNSNFGDRVDLHAWGSDVVTAGEGDLYSGNPATPNDDYTNTFSNTSAATALVAGAAACLQSIYFANTGAKLTPGQMRAVLKDSGIPHQNGSENIGPRPNLPAAIDSLNANYGANLPNFVTVRGDQQDTGGASFGNLSHYKLDRFFEHPVPYDFDFPEDYSQVLRASQEFKTGTTEKYNDWEGIDEVTNHHSFTIEGPTPQPITARFKTAHNATIQTELISANQMNEGYVEFKDPWLRIDGDPQYYDPPYGYRNLGMAGAELEPYPDPPLELFTADPIFKGVFLDQGFPFYDPPYYTVAAPDQPINGVTYFLERWSVSPAGSAQFQNASAGTTVVIFRSPNAVVTTHMKGHLASNSAVATVYNNGRRVVVDDEGVWHLVYEDGGNIYYTASTDNGQNWSAETRLSSTASWGKNHSPSIAYHIAWPNLGVVWDREQSGVHFPVFRYKAGSQPWSPEIFAQSSDQVTSPENCKPVLIHAKLGGRPYNLGYGILCRVNSASKRGIGVLLGGNLVEEEEENESLVWMDLVDQTTQYSDNPAVTSPNPLAPTIHVAWEDNYRILYSNYNGDTFAPVFEVSASLPEDTKSHPAICSTEEGQIDVVWQVYTETQQLLFQHRRCNANGVWGTIFQVALDGAGLTLPSAGAYRADENLITALQAGAQTRFLYFYGSGWAFLDGQYPGSYPAMNDKGIDLMGSGTMPARDCRFGSKINFSSISPRSKMAGKSSRRFPAFCRRLTPACFRVKTAPWQRNNTAKSSSACRSCRA